MTPLLFKKTLPSVAAQRNANAKVNANVVLAPKIRTDAYVQQQSVRVQGVVRAAIVKPLLANVLLNQNNQQIAPVDTDDTYA